MEFPPAPPPPPPHPLFVSMYATLEPPPPPPVKPVLKFINKLSPLVIKFDDHQQTKFYCPSPSLNHSDYDWLINLSKRSRSS